METLFIENQLRREGIAAPRCQVERLMRAEGLRGAIRIGSTREWVTDEAAPEFRPTDDIDVIVEITTRRDYYRFEKQVRHAGLENDQESGVICRFKHPDSGLVLDVMPTEA